MRLTSFITAAMLTVMGLVVGVGHSAHAAAPERVVAFGDSITWGVGTADPDTESWPARIDATRVANPGAQLVGPEGAIHNYQRLVLAQRPDTVIVAFGMNDLHWHSTPQIMQGLRQIVRWNNAAGVRTRIATLTPQSASFPWGIQPQRAELNARIAAHFPGKVVDFYSALANETGELPPRFDSGDGLHPNAAAYARMAKVAQRSLR